MFDKMDTILLKFMRMLTYSIEELSAHSHFEEAGTSKDASFVRKSEDL